MLPSLFSPSGNIVLIKKNLTWTDAMVYCRRHHVDLVHVTSKHIQERVAEEAKNSTSPHVWLGLRYACNLNFWFWISSSTGCYQNWAPGQGSEREYDCDTTGAIEATGGQQWVGLSQTEELNFICSTCAGWEQRAIGALWNNMTVLEKRYLMLFFQLFLQ